MKTNYLIYGFKASGKTTYGKLFSQEKSLYFLDTDEILLKKYNKKNIYELYLNLKENFHKKEFEVFKKEIKKIEKNTVLSVGGSTLLYDDVKISELKEKFNFIFIDTNFTEIIKRIRNQKTIYNDYTNKEIKSIYNKRRTLFLKWSDQRIIM